MANKEKEFLHAWASKNCSDEYTKKVFSKFEEEKDSYFMKRDREKSMFTELSYQGVAELKEELQKLWGTENVFASVLQVVFVSAMKNKPLEAKETSIEQHSDAATELPDFIYCF